MLSGPLVKCQSRRAFVNRIQATWARTKVAIVLAGLTLFSAAPALSEGANQNRQPCPDNSSSSGNSAENPASEQGVEHSAILPDSGGQLASAAPTVKKNGQEVTDTGCPKPPNQLHSSPGAGQPSKPAEATPGRK
jgi:hypothetical protein